MNLYNNYINYIEPPAPRNAAVYKKTPTKITKNQNYNKIYKNGSAINFNKVKARATKYILDKRYRGELDPGSPGNKNILLDSDSELTTNSKNLNNNAGCTKLVIEKIESQVPQINQEYYKFTNQKRNDDNDNENYFIKKNYVIKKAARCDSNLRNNNNRVIERNHMNPKYYLYNYSQEQYFNEISPIKKYYGRSTNNIFNPMYNQKKNVSNKKQDYKNNSAVVRDRNTSMNYNNMSNNNYIYEDGIDNDEMYNSSFIPEKPKNMKYYKIVNNNVRMNNDINYKNKENTLYENYQDLIKLNTFNRISQYNNGQKVPRALNKYYPYPSNNRKIIKIQSAWRGTYVRILMGFYWNLSDFKNILQNIFKTHIYDYFFHFIKNLSHNKKEYNGINTQNYEKSLNDYKLALKRKEEDYDSLLKKYNSLVETCTELQYLVNKSRSEEKKGWSSSNKKNEKYNTDNISRNLLDIKRQKIDFIENKNLKEKNKEKDNLKELKIENKNINFEIISDNLKEIKPEKINEIKKFDIIKIEKKDKFDIIRTKVIQEKIEIKQEQENDDNGNNNKLRAKYKKKKQENYQNYLDYFISNLCMRNADKLIIEGIQKKKEIIPLEISKLEISLINNNEKEESENIKKMKSFENEFIMKDNDNELTILGIKKEDIKINEKEDKKEEKIEKKINLIEENQKHLSIEIQGKNIDLIEKNNNDNNSKIIITNNENEIKEPKNEICKGEEFELINDKKIILDIKPKISENKILEKAKDIELVIEGIKKEPKKIKKKKQKKKESNLEEKVQEKLKLENIEEIPKNNIGFKDFIFIENVNSLTIKRIPKKLNKVENNILKSKPIKITKNILEKVDQIFLEGILYNETNENPEKDIIIKEDNNTINNEGYIDNKTENKISEIEIIPVFNNNLFIKHKKIKRCEKMTEITEELNNIIPCNNYELYIERIIRKIIYINNKEQEISFINNNNKIIYNNVLLEINKENALEINPLSLKNTEICKENDIELTQNKFAFFTEKAKHNMMKMVLPIKLKTTLREFVQRNTFPLLIKYLKEIAQSTKN